MNSQGALGGAASGAAIGTAVMPGIGTAVGAVLGGLLGSGGGGSGGTAANSPTMSDQTASVGVDFSNWTVSTGNSKAVAENSKGAAMPDWLKFAALALAAVVAVRWIAKKV